MKASIYVRVSTADQNHELQIRELEDYAARSGWTIVERYLARLRAEGLTIRAIAAKVGEVPELWSGRSRGVPKVRSGHLDIFHARGARILPIYSRAT